MDALTFSSLEDSLLNQNLESLINEVLNGEDDTKKYGLSFNVETGELCFISYIHNEDKSWVNAYESQNPCIIVGFLSYDDIVFGDAIQNILDRHID